MNGILQGTTRSLVLSIPEEVPVSNILEIELNLSHKGIDSLHGLEDVSVDSEENTLTYNFTQAETLALDPSFSLIWQLRIKTASGIVGTLPSAIKVYDLLSEVLL